MLETQVRSLGWEAPLEEEVATHSSILVWRIPQTEEPGRVQSMGSQRVGHTKVDDRARCGMKSVPATSLPLRPLLLLGLVALVVKNPPANAGDARDVGSIPGLGKSPGEGNGNPLQHSCLENPTDRGA